jgi:hypothetical protein
MQQSQGIAMADDVDIRKFRYKQMSTEDLLALHAAGILGNEAYEVLENELAERKVRVPSRPNEGGSLRKGKRHSQFKQKYLVFTVSFFLASVAEFLTGAVFVVLLRLPFIQKRTLIHELLSIGGPFARIGIFLIILIVSYRAIKGYLENGRSA